MHPLIKQQGDTFIVADTAIVRTYAEAIALVTGEPVDPNTTSDWSMMTSRTAAYRPQSTMEISPDHGKPMIFHVR
jgi:hypothetical protein